MVVGSSEGSLLLRRFQWLLLFVDLNIKVDLSCPNQGYLARWLREHGTSLEHLLHPLFGRLGCHWTLSRRRKGTLGPRTSKQEPEEKREQSILDSKNDGANKTPRLGEGRVEWDSEPSFLFNWLLTKLMMVLFSFQNLIDGILHRYGLCDYVSLIWTVRIRRVEETLFGPDRTPYSRTWIPQDS